MSLSPEYNSHQLLLDLELKLEWQISFVSSVFQNMTEKQLSEQPDVNSWSAAQCFQHLNSYSEYYLPLIKSCIVEGRKSGPHSIYKSHWLGKYFLGLIDPEKSGKKLKAIKKHLPDNKQTPHETIAIHLDFQETLLIYLRSLNTIDLVQNKVATSLSKWIKLNLGDLLQFIVTHNSRHIKQAARIHNEIISNPYV